MLEQVTRVLNIVAGMAMFSTGLYVLIAFGDIFSGTAKAMIMLGVSAYSIRQLTSGYKVGNKN